MHGLSKSRILAWRQCPKRLWLQVNQPDLGEFNSTQSARLQVGAHVGEVARGLWNRGVLIDGENLPKALADTSSALKSGQPVFEATFQHDGALIRADILFPEVDGHRLAEVKSSTAVKDYYLADAAIQAWICRQAGVALSGVEIAHIDNQFVYPGDHRYQGLLKHVDVTAEIAPLEVEVQNWITGARATLSGSCPDITAGDHCKEPFDCPFMAHCTPIDANAPKYPVELLPRGKSISARLRADGYVDLRDVPVDRLSNRDHLRILRVTKSGQPELLPEAAQAIDALNFPRYYIDFETVQMAVPIWAGMRPYMQIPFQWSCHVEAANGDLTHSHFIADGLGNPQRAFAESLMANVGTSGPVIVYNAGFEGRILKELALALPDLAPALEGISNRLFDLLPLARSCYYHPDMLGSWSIKAVLPTIAPDLAYDDLGISDGGMAMDAFAEILHSDTPTERRQQLRSDLLEYCERDTLAMVRLAQFFGGK